MYSEIIGNTHLFPLHYTMGGEGFEVTKNMTFQRSGLYKHVLYKHV